MFGECIEWTGPRNADGYGRVSIGKKKRVYAHRLAWEREHGEIPEGLCVLHLCDNPSCWNVEHLQLGTKAENNRQMAERGRAQRGSRRYNAKLSEGDVIRIRGDYSAGGVSQHQLAAIYGVSAMAINHAIKGTRWRHVLA